jgi:hypothetical protein
MGTATGPFLHIRLDDRRMHVTLAADRGRVSELGTDVCDGFTHAPQPDGSRRRRFPLLREDAGHEDGADPGSKIRLFRVSCGSETQILQARGWGSRPADGGPGRLRWMASARRERPSPRRY